MVEWIWSIIVLGVCAVTDLRQRKVYTMFCLVQLVLLGAFRLGYAKEEMVTFLLGLLPGALLWGVSILTKESLGKGDALVILILGCALGLHVTMEILMWALLLCVVVAVAGRVLNKLTMKSQVPFVPFLLVGEVVTLVVQRSVI